jgi:lipopolysaccharide transport system permease protein
MISYSIIASTNSYISNANLIKKVNFPKVLIPFSITINEMIFLYVSMFILVPFLLFNEIYPTLDWCVFIPILSILTIVFTTSFGIILAVTNVFFKDMGYIVTVYFNVMFFLTPIVYPIDAIPKYIEPYLFLNPFISFIVSWRELFLKGTINYTYLLEAIIYTIFMTVLAIFIYKKYNSKIAENV